MYRIALKMLIEDKAKFMGLILSLSFSAIIIIQQASTFIGIMTRTYGLITDTPQADIWVTDPNVRYIDDIVPLRDIDLFRIRSIEGVAWAVPFFKGTIQARLKNGQFQTCILIGVDDSSLIGSPHTMVEGNVIDIRKPEGIIVNDIAAQDKLSWKAGPNFPARPLAVGDTLELNDFRAEVVGLCKISRTFQSQPVIYTTYKRALSMSPVQRKLLSFVLVKANDKTSIKELIKKITLTTGMSAYTKDDFAQLTVNYYLKYTGIPINFGFSVFLGLLVGASIAGLIFYNFIGDNLRYLALFAVMGASRRRLILMSVLQAFWVAFIGWGVGSGTAAFLGFLFRNSELAFRLTWGVFLGTGFIIFMICMGALMFSIRRIFNIELWSMFK